MKKFRDRLTWKWWARGYRAGYNDAVMEVTDRMRWAMVDIVKDMRMPLPEEKES